MISKKQKGGGQDFCPGVYDWLYDKLNEIKYLTSSLTQKNCFLPSYTIHFPRFPSLKFRRVFTFFCWLSD